MYCDCGEYACDECGKRAREEDRIANCKDKDKVAITKRFDSIKDSTELPYVN